MRCRHPGPRCHVRAQKKQHANKQKFDQRNGLIKPTSCLTLFSPVVFFEGIDVSKILRHFVIYKQTCVPLTYFDINPNKSKDICKV